MSIVISLLASGLARLPGFRRHLAPTNSPSLVPASNGAPGGLVWRSARIWDAGLRETGRLPVSVEALLVIGLVFGLPIAGSLRPALDPHRATCLVSGASLLQLVGFEGFAGALACVFLHVRGVRSTSMGWGPPVRGLAEGLGLVMAVLSFNFLQQLAVVKLFQTHPVLGMGTEGAFSAGAIAVTSIVNGIYEEVFVNGYLVSRLRKSHGVGLAIALSACVRLLYHTYQGAWGVLSIAPIAIAFSAWFARTGRLGPVIVAHTVIDAVSITALYLA